MFWFLTFHTFHGESSKARYSIADLAGSTGPPPPERQGRREEKDTLGRGEKTQRQVFRSAQGSTDVRICGRAILGPTENLKKAEVFSGAGRKEKRNLQDLGFRPKTRQVVTPPLAVWL